MASKAVEDAVDAYLAANWAGLPVLKENEQGEIPSDGSPFIILQFPVRNVERISIGQRTYREEGGIRIIINVQRGAGTAAIRQHGDALADLFRDQTFNGVHCGVPTEPFTDDASDRGVYFSGSVVVPFWFVFSDEE